MQERKPFSNDPSRGTLPLEYMPTPPSTSTQHTQLELRYWSRWRAKQVINTPSGGRTKLSLSVQSHISRSMERKYWLINSSSSKYWSLLHIHQVNWSWPSSTNYAATHHICLIPLSCSENHTSQPLLMPVTKWVLAILYILIWTETLLLIFLEIVSPHGECFWTTLFSYLGLPSSLLFWSEIS